MMFLFMIFSLAFSSHASAGLFDVKKYLTKFGYRDEKLINLQVDNSLKLFQKTFHLAPTGVLDPATLKLMQTPRCGNNDKPKSTQKYQTKWLYKNLTYYFNNYTPDLPKSDVRSLTEQAIKYWADVTPLTFQEKSKGDIVIHFGGKKHNDGTKTCGYDFDGPGGVLAHAFFPMDGRLHIDDDETYTMKSFKGFNYLWVATHEFGHILGLGHDTDNTEAVMYPYYRPYDPSGMELHENDIKRIQEIYGKPNQVTTAPPTLPVTSTRATKPVTTVTPKGCYDNSSNCHYLVNVCRLNKSLVEFTKRECRKTCNYCTTIAPTKKQTTVPPTPCVDRAMNCASAAAYCKTSDDMKIYCRKTCNYC